MELVQYSRAQHLPFDILDVIFRTGISSKSGEYHPRVRRFLLAITAVCATWRNGALAIKALWSIVVFDGRRKEEWPLQSLWISRTGNTPILDILIRPDEEHEGLFFVQSLKTFKSIMRLVVPHASRWRSFTTEYRLALKLLRVLCQRLRTLSLPNLQHLELRAVHWYTRNWTALNRMPQLPSLREISLFHFPAPWTRPLMRNLQSIHIADPGLQNLQPLTITSVLYHLFSTSPDLRLVSIGLYGPELPFRPRILIPPAPHERIVMDALEYLDLDANPEVVLHLLEWVRFPALRIFYNHGRRAGIGFHTTSASVLRSIAVRNPLPALREFHCAAEVAAKDLWDALRTLSELQSLYVANVDFAIPMEEGHTRLGDSCKKVSRLELRSCLGVTMKELLRLVERRPLIQKIYVEDCGIEEDDPLIDALRSISQNISITVHYHPVYDGPPSACAFVRK